MNLSSRILIVDDEPFNVDYLEQELEDLGYAAASPRNGLEASNKGTTQAPDLILLDVMMPIMDGFTVCHILKENDETRMIPVVIMTALDGFDDRIKGIEAGADDFFTKAVNQHELRARIQTTLKLKHTIDRKTHELRRAKDHFAKYVPEAVKHLVTANPEVPALARRQQDVSVLFLDISGYARLSAQLPPDTLKRLVERYFSTFLDQIHEAGGDINETAGDGFMAIFSDADGCAHAVTAVDTALALLGATETLNETNGTEPLAIHMGLNSGFALVGSTRLEGIRGTRWTFTASGPVTNLAARLPATAGAGQLLVGLETVRRLGDSFRLERLGHASLKNVDEAVEICRVLGPARATFSGPTKEGWQPPVPADANTGHTRRQCPRSHWRSGRAVQLRSVGL
jgi:class 3 adenylate cyclase/CheY-like chemotaxis protein